MADHATKNTTTNNLPGLTAERVKAGVTIVVTLYALVNAGLNLAGYNTLPFTNEQVSATVFSIVGVIGTIYGWWKNQNITSASLAGQQLVDALKKEGVVNGISAAKSAALSAASAVARTEPKDATDTATATADTTAADADLEPGGTV